MTTASPTHTTPHHATGCSRETPQWLPTSLITGCNGAISWHGQERLDPPKLPYDRAVNWQSHLHVRPREAAVSPAQLPLSLVPAR